MNSLINYEGKQQQAWVVFTGTADLPWLRVLRNGFRHCFVVLHDGVRWVSLDPMLHQMELKVHHHLPGDFDFPAWLAMRGAKVLPAAIDDTHTKPAPWRPFTCVEAVKRVLGIHARGVMTPWQLYQYLTGQTTKEINHGKHGIAA